MRFFISTGEPSGDLHAANLIRALRRRIPNAEFEGYGGTHMARAGARVFYPLVDLAVMWFARVLLNIRTFLRLLGQAERHFLENPPDALILIDYPGFNFQMARRAKQAGIPVIWFVPPQLWAWAGWRVKKMQKYVDLVLCNLPFEADWYKQKGVEHATLIGHPYFDELYERKLDETVLAEQRAQGRPLVAILPGSRTQEITRNLPMMIQAAAKLHANRPDVRFVITCLHDRHAKMATEILAIAGLKTLPIDIVAGKTPEIIHLADLAWSVSGSVSLELMMEALPTVIVYKLRSIDLMIARPFIQVKYITLVNLLADRPLMPEYLTTHDVSDELAQWGRKWLNDPADRLRVSEELAELRDRVAIPGASERAAERIAEMVQPRTGALRGPHAPVAAPGQRTGRENAS